MSWAEPRESLHFESKGADEMLNNRTETAQTISAFEFFT